MVQNSFTEGIHALMFISILIQLWIIELFLVELRHTKASTILIRVCLMQVLEYRFELCPAEQQARVLDFADCRSPKTALSPIHVAVRRS